jgi:hypothetical protein
MTDYHVQESFLPGSAVPQDESKPAPEKDDTHDLETPCPIAASGTFGIKRSFVEGCIGQAIQVETGEKHDYVE